MTKDEKKRIDYLLDLLGKITTSPWRWGCWFTEFEQLEPEDIRDRLTLEHAPQYVDNKAVIRKRQYKDIHILNVDTTIENKYDAELISIAPEVIKDLIGIVQKLDNELSKK